MQGRMIAEAEIVAEPDDAGESGMASHQMVNSHGARWVHARTGHCNSSGPDAYLKHFQAKACRGLDPGRRPVRVKKTRQIKNLEPRFDFDRNGKGSGYRTCAKELEMAVNRYVVLYLATLIVIVPIDLVFLGLVAKGFFAAQVGDMLGEIRRAPAILFYLLYVVGMLIFVSASVTATAQSTLLYGALFGFFCYATFELTSLSLLKHWTWPVVVMDVTWGSFVTAVSSTLGLMIANWISPRI
jgi:uncharacterized membrane protein